MKQRGAHKGVPDLLVFRAGKDGKHCLAMELKIGTNYLDDDQQRWKLEQAGGSEG